MKLTLRAARTNARLTQEDMARKLGVSTRTIANWEDKPDRLKPFVVISYAYICGVPVDDIFLSSKFAKSEI